MFVKFFFLLLMLLFFPLSASAQWDILELFREIQTVMPQSHISQMSETIEEIVSHELKSSPETEKKMEAITIPTISGSYSPHPEIERYDPTQEFRTGGENNLSQKNTVKKKYHPRSSFPKLSSFFGKMFPVR